MSSTMHLNRGVTVLPVIFALLVAIVIIVLLQQQQRGISQQQATLVIRERAELIAQAAGEWTAWQLLNQPTSATPIRCPNNLAFSDASQPQYSVSILCNEQYFGGFTSQHFNLQIVVEYASPGNQDYIRQQYEWTITL